MEHCYLPPASPPPPSLVLVMSTSASSWESVPKVSKLPTPRASASDWLTSGIASVAFEFAFSTNPASAANAAKAASFVAGPSGSLWKFLQWLWIHIFHMHVPLCDIRKYDQSNLRMVAVLEANTVVVPATPDETRVPACCLGTPSVMNLCCGLTAPAA